MTTEFVLRLDKKRAEHLKMEARKRRRTPNAVVRQALDNFLGEPFSSDSKNGTHAARKGKSSAGNAEGGIGWAEHFEWLKKNGRKIDWRRVQELDDLENTRGL